MTTASSLLSAGESFFTTLLSGRHENVTDSSGALFIDSDGWGRYCSSACVCVCVHVRACMRTRGSGEGGRGQEEQRGGEKGH